MKTPIKAIREKCLDCSGGSFQEVEFCLIPDCSLFPYRFGMRPGTAAAKGKMVKHIHDQLDQLGTKPDVHTVQQDGQQDGHWQGSQQDGHDQLNDQLNEARCTHTLKEVGQDGQKNM